MKQIVPLVLGAVAVLSAPAMAGVIVVASNGSGDFTNLPDAVAAAAEGDTLLVKLVAHDPVVIAGKSLTIVGDHTSLIASKLRLTVQDLGPGQRVVLRHLAIYPFAPGASGLELHDNAGPVWIEDCDVVGGDGMSTAFTGCVGFTARGGPGLVAENSASVALIRCRVLGGLGTDVSESGGSHFEPSSGGPGAVIAASNVAFYECTIEGGAKGEGEPLCVSPTASAAGLELDDALVLMSGCALVGGGDGVRLGAGSELQTLDSTIAAGADGVPLVDDGGVLTGFTGAARSFELSSPLREGEAGTLAIQGVQGDLVGWFVSAGSGTLPMPARKGWFLLSPSPLLGPFVLGAIGDPGGAWNLPVAGPHLPASLEALTLHLQAYFVDGGGVTLGSGTVFTLVDASL